MSKESISARIDSNLLEGLNRLIVGEDSSYITLTSKLEALLQMSIRNYNKAGRSLMDKFTELEFSYMLQAFNGVILQYELTDTLQYLRNNIQDFYAYGSMGFFSDEPVDVQNLISKIDALDDFQALFVINSIVEYWNKVNVGEEINISDLYIVQKEMKEL